MSTARQKAIEAIANTEYDLNQIDFRTTHIKDLFGALVFSEEVQQERLPKPVFKALQKTIKQGAPLDPTIADAVASAMKDWAIEKGRHALHAPVPADDRPDRREARQLPQPTGDGTAIAEFSGKELVKGEPDASVVPLRRHPRHLRGPRLHRLGPDQPAYIREAPNGATLVIPTAFVSWTGEALDKKTPLLRSMEALSQPGAAHPAAVRQQRGQEGLHHRRPRAGILPDRQELLLRPARPDQLPAARCSAPSRPRARSWRISTSAPSPSACWPAWPTARPSCSSSACRSRRGTTKSPRASTRSPRSSRTRNLATDHNRC